MAKAQNTPVEEPEQEESQSDPAWDADTQPVEPELNYTYENIAPTEAGAVEPAAAQPESIDVDGGDFPLGRSAASEHYSIETRLTPTGNPVVTIRRNGYVGDEYDIPAAYFGEYVDLLGKV